MSIKAWLFFLDRLALATGIVVALLTGMTGSATPEYSPILPEVWNIIKNMQKEGIINIINDITFGNIYRPKGLGNDSQRRNNTITVNICHNLRPYLSIILETTGEGEKLSGWSF